MRASQFIVEYDQSKTVTNYGNALVAVGSKDPYIRSARDPWMRQFLEAARNPETANIAATILMQTIEKADPTPHKEYSQWLAKLYATGIVPLEDLLSRGADTLQRFNALKVKKKLAPEHRDINRFKNFQQFEQIVASYPDIEQQQVDKGQAKEVFNDGQIRVIVPEDQTAACYYGQGTRWCTAAKSNNMYRNYASKGTLYIVIPLKPHHTGEKYQFHFETGSFMDETDSPIDASAVVARYPSIKTAFEKQIKLHGELRLLLSDDELSNHFPELRKRVFQYLRTILKSKLPAIQVDLKSEFIAYGIKPVDARELAGSVTTEVSTDPDQLSDTAADLFSIGIREGSDDDNTYDTLSEIFDTWINDTGLLSVFTDYEDNGAGDSMEMSYAVRGALEKYVFAAYKNAEQSLVEQIW